MPVSEVLLNVITLGLRRVYLVDSARRLNIEKLKENRDVTRLLRALRYGNRKRLHHFCFGLVGLGVMGMLGI